LCLVDAAYAPFLQRFAMIEEIVQTGILADYPLIKAWSDALLANDAVIGSVAPSFEEVFFANLKNRGFYVGTLLGDKVAAAE
jgi:glutathione S-transferase